MCSCFFSSRLKRRIYRTPVFRKRERTAFPNEPEPPVTIKTLSSNIAVTLGPQGRSCLHFRDKFRPGRRGEPRRLAKLIRIQRSIDHEIILRDDLQVTLVGIAHEAEQRALVYGRGADVIHSAEFRSRNHEVSNNSRQGDRWQSREDS